jgi:hypothetical protein
VESLPTRSETQEKAVKMIPDRTGRFRERPYYELSELEERSEQAITAFLRQRYGFDRSPVPTEAFTVLIERDATDLDLSATLSDKEHDVFGVTYFLRGKKPHVRILRELWEQSWRVNRLRTTLAHEYGHVLLHTWLYDRPDAPLGPQTCYSRTMLPTVGVVDWMEWQAGYVSGALLMPQTFIGREVNVYFRSREISSSVARDSREAAELAQRISLIFEVSSEAAAVRLSQLGFLSD